MDFVAFWTDMSWIVILLLCLTALFAIIEACIPGFGVFGILSLLCGTASVIVEGVLAKSFFAALFLFVLVLIFGLIVFSIFAFSARKGTISKTPLVEKKSALPEDYVKNNEKRKLIGRVGVITSPCKPVGKAEINGEFWTVIAEEKNIESGRAVEVIAVKNNNVVVREIKGEKLWKNR